MAVKNSIIIKLPSLFVPDGKKFLLSVDGEKAILEFLEMEKKFEEAKERFKNLLLKEMKKRKIVRVDGEKIKISRRIVGQKYKVVDFEEAEDFCKKVVRYYPDSQLIDEFVEGTGEIPSGIEINKKRKEIIVLKKDE